MFADEHIAERRAAASQAAESAVDPADINLLMPVDSKVNFYILWYML